MQFFDIRRTLVIAALVLSPVVAGAAYDLNPNDLSIVGKAYDLNPNELSVIKARLKDKLSANTSDSDIGPIFLVGATASGWVCGAVATDETRIFIGFFKPAKGFKSFALNAVSSDQTEGQSIIQACAERGINLR